MKTYSDNMVDKIVDLGIKIAEDKKQEFDIEKIFQQYKEYTIMAEGHNKDSYLICREKKWHDFFMPNPIVVLRGLGSIAEAKYWIDSLEVKDV